MSYRVQHRFWLDIMRDDEATLNDEVVYLKQQRSFASTIRDGIRLICDLRAGRTDVLLELFPFVQAELSGSRAGGDNDMRVQLERLERALLGQGGGTVMAPVVSNGGPKPLAVTQVATPVYDDDDIPALDIREAESDGQASKNFLDSAFALQ